MRPEQLRNKIESRDSVATTALYKAAMETLEAKWDGRGEVEVIIPPRTDKRVIDRVITLLRTEGWRAWETDVQMDGHFLHVKEANGDR